MERDKETSDDHANYYGSIKHLKKATWEADMSQIEDAMDGLMTAIRNSEEFIRYQAIKEKVHGFPKLESQITEFRKKNYLLQNSQGTVDLYEETDRMENEYREFRKNPMVSEYLAAENALCKIMQQINWTLIEGLEFEVGFEES